MTPKSLALLTSVCFAAACGDGSSSVDPDVQDFDVDPAVQQEIDDAADNGQGAEGTYTFDDGSDTLTITLVSSTFDCNVEPGDLVINVVELTATTMVWTFVDDNGMVTWTRADNSTEVSVVGIWRTSDPDLFLILTPDGNAQLIGMFDSCQDDRPQNDNSCYEMKPAGASISLDGDLSDWDAVPGDGTLTDDANDHTGASPGTDLRTMKVDYANAALYVLMQVGGPLDTNLQAQPPNDGYYRLTVRGDNGLSYVERFYYDTNAGAWTTMGDSNTITAAAGTNGVEWRVDTSAYDGQQGFVYIDLIMLEVFQCAEGSCDTPDTMSCGYIAVP